MARKADANEIVRIPYPEARWFFQNSKVRGRAAKFQAFWLDSAQSQSPAPARLKAEPFFKSANVIWGLKH